MTKPTIEELERLLSGEDSLDIEILPSGEIREKEREEGRPKEIINASLQQPIFHY